MLASRKGRVDEAFYELHPSLRPQEDPTSEVKKSRKRSARQIEAAYRRLREREKNPAVQAGRVAGHSAASEIEISGTPKARRLESEPFYTEWREIDSTDRQVEQLD